MILSIGLIIARCGGANLESQHWVVEASGQPGLYSEFLQDQAKLHSEVLSQNASG